MKTTNTIIAISLVAALGCGSRGGEDGDQAHEGRLVSEAFWLRHYPDCAGLVWEARAWAGSCGVQAVDGRCVRFYLLTGTTQGECRAARLEVAEKVRNGDCYDPRPVPDPGDYESTCYPILP